MYTKIIITLKMMIIVIIIIIVIIVDTSKTSLHTRDDLQDNNVPDTCPGNHRHPNTFLTIHTHHVSTLDAPVLMQRMLSFNSIILCAVTADLDTL